MRVDDIERRIQAENDELIRVAIRDLTLVEYDMAGSAMVMDGPDRGRMFGASGYMAACRAEIKRLRAEMRQAIEMTMQSDDPVEAAHGLADALRDDSSSDIPDPGAADS